MKKIALNEIQNGAVIELFEEELRKVLANIEDENTTANSYFESGLIKMMLQLLLSLKLTAAHGLIRPQKMLWNIFSLWFATFR